MSAGADLLARAHAAPNGKRADDLAMQAIAADPDLAAAYALRGRIAADRGDCVAAAHHYRVAYSRGERGAETRAVLAACVAAAGDGQRAEQIALGARLPGALEAFGELVQMQGAGLRGVLSVALPPRGTPAFLPGEGPPESPHRHSLPPQRASLPPAAMRAPLRSAPPGALPPRRSVPPARIAHVSTPPRASEPPRPRRLSAPPQRRSAPPRARRLSTPPQRLSTPPAAAGDPRRPRASAPPRAAGIGEHRRRRSRTVNLGSPTPRPSAPPPQVAPPVDDGPASWLETSHTQRSPATAATSGAASWLEDAPFGDIQGGSIQASEGDIELAWDPGELQVAARSPVTGKVIHNSELVTAQRGASMPGLGDDSPAAEPAPHAPRPQRRSARPPAVDPGLSAPDAFEAHEPLTTAGVTNLRLALNLPGPVITASGQRPQQLGKAVALGLTSTELVLGAPDGRTPPVRLSLAQLRRMDVVRGGQQVSFVLGDGRQLHLDLRPLRVRAEPLARQLIDELTHSLQMTGAQVNHR